MVGLQDRLNEFTIRLRHADKLRFARNCELEAERFKNQALVYEVQLSSLAVNFALQKVHAAEEIFTTILGQIQSDPYLRDYSTQMLDQSGPLVGDPTQDSKSWYPGKDEDGKGKGGRCNLHLSGNASNVRLQKQDRRVSIFT